MFTKTELDILTSFFPDIEEIKTTKDIEKAVSYSHERVHTVLHTLEKRGFVVKRGLGNVNAFKLNKKRPELFLIYVYYTEKRKRDVEVDERVKRILKEFMELYEDKFHSLIFLDKSIKRNGNLFNVLFLMRQIDAEIIKNHENCSNNSSDKRDEKCRPFFMSIEEFEKIKDTAPALYQHLINGVVLAGIENFYMQVYNGGRFINV